MSERTVKLLYFHYVDDEGRGLVAMQGDTVDFDEAAEERGDALGAFTDSPEVETEEEVQVTSENIPSDEDELDTVPGELDADEIDNLSGSQLDSAADAAGIDVTTGGSLASGAMSADEKRAALKAARAD